MNTRLSRYRLVSAALTPCFRAKGCNHDARNKDGSKSEADARIRQHDPVAHA